MAVTVSKLLELLEEKHAKNGDYLFSINSAPFQPEVPMECACIALTEIEVCSSKIHSLKSRKPEMIKIVLVVEAFREFDHSVYKCLTVKDLKKFLKSIDDKNECVYITTPNQVFTGWYGDVINVFKVKLDKRSTDKKMRELFGNNILHLAI